GVEVARERERHARARGALRRRVPRPHAQAQRVRERRRHPHGDRAARGGEKVERMSTPRTGCRPEIEALIAALRRVGADVAAPHADDVDKNARFPHEAIAALRRERALAACVPRALGGFGASTSEMALMTQALGEHCAATGLIFAMHLIQVGAIARHGLSSAHLRGYLADVAERQFLIASVTSEVGTGGDLRASVCAVEPDPAGFRVKKNATTVSYAEHADDLLLTARRAPDAPSS